MACIFCQIASGKIPSELLHQDDEVIAFRDISPQSPTHILILPRKHIPSLADLNDRELPILAKMAGVANKLAKKEGLSEKGYRVAINCGSEGGQSVGHLHMHLLGGRQLSGQLG
ncbi:MAG: histidine triad nucleotide-binding protein [Dehalococcoidia bacterium]